MTLNEYTRLILKKSGCPEDAYAAAIWPDRDVVAMAVEDLKESEFNCPAEGFTYEDVAAELVRIGNASYVPPKKAPYHVVWDTDDCTDGFDADTLEGAKDAALETLMQWQTEECSGWKWEDGKPCPTQEQIESWDYMIDNCSVCVYELVNSNGESWDDQYQGAWSPSYEDEEQIGWLNWNELSKKFNQNKDR